MTKGKELPECFKDYEDGKHRRYNLLFAVNGGAFTVAGLFSDPNTRTLLGAITLLQLSVGMMLFTVLMVTDIFLFGRNMQSTLPDDASRQEKTVPIFGRVGKTVLILIGFLIFIGWFLVAWGQQSWS